MTLTPSFDMNSIDWAKSKGLVPAIVQDYRSLRVLMLGYMNTEALQVTMATGFVTFFSRSKQRLWKKGEVSGHTLQIKDMRLDCDGDTLLIIAEPNGPVCHKGTTTCFGEADDASLATLADLAATIKARRQTPKRGSYTSDLFQAGLSRIAQKVGEEGVETALAAASSAPNLPEEAADLLYHLFVALEANDLDWLNVLKVLRARQR